MKKILPIVVLLGAFSLTGCNNDIKKETFLVQFDTNGGSFIEVAKVSDGEKVEKPTDPTKENYIFDCWTLNGDAYDFNSAVTSDFILKANWFENFPAEKCSFTFVSDYCELNNEKFYDIGKDVTLTLTSDDSNNVPSDLDVVLGDKVGVNGVDYNYVIKGEKTAELSLIISADVTVKALISASDNAYRISSKEAFDAAIAMNNINFIQREYEYYITTPNIITGYDILTYLSPTVNKTISTYLDASSSVNKRTSEEWHEKVDDKCYQYYLKDGVMTKTECPLSEFVDSSSLSPAYTLGLASITYDTIKDCFDTNKLCYEFVATNAKGARYNVIMVFKDNKLLHFEYELFKEDGYDGYYGESGYATYTYLTITPELPEMPEVE